MKAENIDNIEKISALIAEAINTRELPDVLTILTSLLLTAAITGGIDQDDLEEFLAEAIDNTYADVTYTVEYLQ